MCTWDLNTGEETFALSSITCSRQDDFNASTRNCGLLANFIQLIYKPENLPTHKKANVANWILICKR